MFNRENLGISTSGKKKLKKDLNGFDWSAWPIRRERERDLYVPHKLSPRGRQPRHFCQRVLRRGAPLPSPLSPSSLSLPSPSSLPLAALSLSPVSLSKMGRRPFYDEAPPPLLCRHMPPVTNPMVPNVGICTLKSN